MMHSAPHGDWLTPDFQSSLAFTAQLHPLGSHSSFPESFYSLCPLSSLHYYRSLFLCQDIALEGRALLSCMHLAQAPANCGCPETCASVLLPPDRMLGAPSTVGQDVFTLSVATHHPMTRDQS